MKSFFKKTNRFKPAVSNHALLLLAGFVWVAVGSMLLILAFTWLSSSSHRIIVLFFGIGFFLALLIHHFGFLRIVDKNLKRILQMREKRCLFAFIPWKSYLIIAVMICLGAVLRHSAIPKPYLAVLYVAIGLALILSSIRYIRIFIDQKKR